MGLVSLTEEKTYTEEFIDRIEAIEAFQRKYMALKEFREENEAR